MSPAPVYVVKQGDFLWKIVRDKYSAPGKTLSERDTRRIVQQVYAHNRGAIGANPNLIYSGLKIELIGLPAPTAQVNPAGEPARQAQQAPQEERLDPDPITDARPAAPAPPQEPAAPPPPVAQTPPAPPAPSAEVTATPEGITANIEAPKTIVSWEHNYFNTVTTQGNVDYSSRMNMGAAPASNNVVPYVPFYYNAMVNSFQTTKTWLGLGLNFSNLISLEYLNGGLALGANSDGSALLLPDLKNPKIGVGVSWPIFAAYFLTTITGQNEVLAQRDEINKRIAAIEKANSADTAKASRVSSDAAPAIQSRIAQRNIILGQLKAQRDAAAVALAGRSPRGGLPLGDHVIPYPFVNFIGLLFRDPVAIAEEQNKKRTGMILERVQVALQDPNPSEETKLATLSDLSYLSAMSASSLLPRPDRIRIMSYLAYSVPQDVQVVVNAFNLARVTDPKTSETARRSLIAVFRESPKAVQTAVLGGYQNLAKLIETQLAKAPDPELTQAYQRLVAIPAFVAAQ